LYLTPVASLAQLAGSALRLALLFLGNVPGADFGHDLPPDSKECLGMPGYGLFVKSAMFLC